MKKLFLSVLMAVATFLVSSCSSVSIDGWIDWSVGFSGGTSEFYETFEINKIYRSVFADYGQIVGDAESTGSKCIIRGASSKNEINKVFTRGIEEANSRLESERSYTVSTTKPEGKCFTLYVGVTWDNWTDSKTYYLSK